MGEIDPVKDEERKQREVAEKQASPFEEDWNRLALLADRILPRGKSHRLVSVVSLGMYILSIIGLFPLYNLTLRMGSWILHTAWFCLTISMVLGIVTIVMDARKETELQVAVETLIREMKVVKQNHDRSDD